MVRSGRRTKFSPLTCEFLDISHMGGLSSVIFFLLQLAVLEQKVAEFQLGSCRRMPVKDDATVT